MIRIGSKTDALQQLESIYQQAGVKSQNYLKFCPNIAKIEKIKDVASAPSTAETPVEKKTPAYEGEIVHDGIFTIKDIKL